MIKIALKHFIYEKCIDVLFDAVYNNFIINPYDLYPGQKLKWIKCRGYISFEFTDVEIIEISNHVHHGVRLTINGIAKEGFGGYNGQRMRCRFLYASVMDWE